MDEDDIKLNPDEWLRYDEYTVGFMSDDELLEHFEIQGPGPPSANVNLFLPPPPIPGSQQDCIMFSSHFDTCSSVQVQLDICKVVLIYVRLITFFRGTVRYLYTVHCIVVYRYSWILENSVQVWLAIYAVVYRYGLIYVQ